MCYSWQVAWGDRRGSSSNASPLRRNTEIPHASHRVFLRSMTPCRLLRAHSDCRCLMTSCLPPHPRNDVVYLQHAARELAATPIARPVPLREPNVPAVSGARRRVGVGTDRNQPFLEPADPEAEKVWYPSNQTPFVLDIQ